MGDKSMIELQPSVTKSGTVRSRRPREHLTEAEIERLMSARPPERPLWSPRCHGDPGRLPPRAALERARRPAMGPDRFRAQDHPHQPGEERASTHYLSNSELRAFRRLQRENLPGPHVFVSERGGPVTTAWFRKMMARLGKRALMPFLIHPHMLRHSCKTSRLGH
jgi:integrase